MTPGARRRVMLIALGVVLTNFVGFFGLTPLYPEVARDLRLAVAIGAGGALLAWWAAPGDPAGYHGYLRRFRYLIERRRADGTGNRRRQDDRGPGLGRDRRLGGEDDVR
jgi:hypothetical protein